MISNLVPITFDSTIPFWVKITAFIFTVIVAGLCIGIYRKTRETYELTHNPGIKYFREAFLYLAISYIIRFVSVSKNIIIQEYSLTPFPDIVSQVLLVLLGYFSTIGTIYLIINTNKWAKCYEEKLEKYGHLFAAALSLVSLIDQSYFTLLCIQIIILMGAIVIASTNKTQNKLTTHPHNLYLLLLVFWIVNLLTFELAPAIGWELTTAIKLVTVAIFGFIYYRVSKWL